MLFAKMPPHFQPKPHIQACEDLAAGDSCSFTGKDGSSISDTCQEKAGGGLACGRNPESDP